jgi:hypothetical protein
MKIKCFSKRKLNVRISKTKIKCAILGFSQNCCIKILGKSRKKLVKFSKNSVKTQQILANFATFCKNQQKNSAIFNEKIEIRERCKGVYCVDLGESFPTNIYLQNLASIQLRTSPVKFACSPRTDPPGPLRRTVAAPRRPRGAVGA